MQWRWAALLLAGIPQGSVYGQTLPPMESPAQALQQLSLPSASAKRAALENLKSACRGRLRHAVKDSAPVLGAVERLVQDSSADVRRAALDTVRCFSASHATRLLAPGLKDLDPKVASYAGEIAAQVTEPEVTELLLSRLEAQRAECAGPKAEAPLVEVCVWLVYSAGATVSPNHDRALRERIGVAIEPTLAWPHPKLREVAVETLAKTRLHRYAASISELVQAEKKGAHALRNDPALLSRFEQRAKALKKSGEL